MCAAGALVHYLRDTQKADLAHVRSDRLQTAADCLLIDPITLKHLEIVESMRRRPRGLAARRDRSHGDVDGRPAAARLAAAAAGRARARSAIASTPSRSSRSARTDRGKFREALKAVQDLERLVARAALGTAGPRDLVGLKQSLAAVPRVRAAARRDCQAPLLAQPDRRARRPRRRARAASIAALVDEPPALARDGGFIRDGVDAELDELRRISRSGKQVIAEMEERERARTGISSLKVRYNRVFGYYIEISKSNLHAVPADYQRKQTIAGGERFITPALKEYEEKVLGADERILERELEIFEALRAARRRRGAAHPGHRARAGDARRAGRPRRDRTLSQLHQAARARRRRARRRPTGAIRWSSGCAGGAFVPNDIDLERRRRISW